MHFSKLVLLFVIGFRNRKVSAVGTDFIAVGAESGLTKSIVEIVRDVRVTLAPPQLTVLFFETLLENFREN